MNSPAMESLFKKVPDPNVWLNKKSVICVFK